MSERQLREAYDSIVSARAETDRSGCPRPEEILELIGSRASGKRRVMLLDHVMSCGPCRVELEFLRAIHGAGRRLLDGEDSS